MTKEITRSEIETMKYMFSTFPESTRKTLVSNQCQKYKLTDEFVSEFREYITSVDFSTSPELDYRTLANHKELFDIDAWLSNSTKSLEPMLHEEFVGEYLVGKDIDSVLLGVKPSQITTEVFEAYFGRLSDKARSFFLNSSRVTSEELVRKHPSDVSEEIFKNKFVKIDWSNALIEHILTNKKLTVRFLVSALSQTKDLGFIKRMLTTELDYADSNDTFDMELKGFLMGIHQDYFQLVFSLLEKHSPNAITYSVLERMLEINNFLDEDFLVQNAEHFLRNGMLSQLAQYARRNDYNALLLVLRLQ